MGNPFEYDDQFKYSIDAARENHGADVLVHLSVGQGDVSDTHDQLIDDNPHFESWLIKNNRFSKMVPTKTIDLVWSEDGSDMGGTGYVMISLPNYK